MSSTAAAHASEDAGARVRRGLGLKPQLLLLLFAINLAAAIAYSTVLYKNSQSQIVDGIDGRLRTAAFAVVEMLPSDYHRRIADPQSISDAEFDRLQATLSRFAERSHLEYVYTYMRFGDDIRTVSTSATPAELRAGTQTRYFTLYDTAPAPLYRSFEDGQVRFDEYHDSFGRFRSIYVPVKDSGGRVHVVGADVDLATLNRELREALIISVLVGLGMFALSMAVGWLLVARIVGPLVRLTDYTRNIAHRSFRSDADELAAMQAISGSRGDEVGRLAEAMTGMIATLQRYLVEVETATAARERVEGELSAARDIQVGMLPSVFPPFPDRRDIDVFAVLESAKEVGGDLYNFFMIDERRLFFVIGDVSGKGVAAALFMAMTTTLFKAHAASPGRSSAEIMARINRELSRDNAAEMFVTAFAGILDLETGVLDYSDGGHEAPFVVRADGRVERVPKQPGTALGVFDDLAFAGAQFQVEPGDALVLFTDGVSEATNGDDALFTTDRIAVALTKAGAAADAQAITEQLMADVRAFVDGVPQSDDIAILVVSYGGRSSDSALDTRPADAVLTQDTN